MDHDLTEQWVVEGVWRSTFGPATVADFDGDGEAEIAVLYASTDTTYAVGAWWQVYEADGTLLWEEELDSYNDVGTHTAAAVDIDLDGAAELVVRNVGALVVMDGATGATLASVTGLRTSAGYGAPAIADVDGDGSLEIVTTSRDIFAGQGGIQVYGGEAGDWPRARGSWNQHGYSVTNVGVAGAVPRAAAPSWPAYNSFRAADTDALGEVDATVAVSDLCASDCDVGEVSFAVRVGNAGTATIPAGVPYRVEGYGDGAWATVTDGESDEEIAPGATATAVWVTVDASEVVDGLRVIVDDDRDTKVLTECNGMNNVAEWIEPVCG